MGANLRGAIDMWGRLVRGKRERGPRSLLLDRMPRSTVCAEIGVWKGQFSKEIHRKTSPKALHLIDPWEFQSEFPDRMFGGKVATCQSDMDEIYEGVKSAFALHANVVINKGRSEDVLPKFEDSYFDWVYIDGNHYYDYVMADLQLCRAKVKVGGIIAGDDYTWGETDGFPVKRAVQDFIAQSGLADRLEVIDSQFIIRL